jgi:beta-lactamase superfamily II metal-dependent hydrolase
MELHFRDKHYHDRTGDEKHSHKKTHEHNSESDHVHNHGHSKDSEHIPAVDKSAAFLKYRIEKNSRHIEEFLEFAEKLSASNQPEAASQMEHPADDFPTDDTNASSMVLSLRLGGASALMMADLPSADEVDAFPDCDVIKVAHHGSNDSTGPRLLALSSPSVAVISVGPNGYGHPGGEAIARILDAGAKIYRTDECGAVTVALKPNGDAEVRCFRSGEEMP